MLEITAQDLINQVNSLWEQLKKLQPREFFDDAEEPLCFDILGIMYDYKSARPSQRINPGYHSDYEEEIILTLGRDDEYIIKGDSDDYQFPISIEAFIEYRDGLQEIVDRENNS